MRMVSRCVTTKHLVVISTGQQVVAREPFYESCDLKRSGCPREKAATAVLGRRRRNRQKGILVNAVRAGGLSLPVIGVVLNDIDRVNPKISKPESADEFDGVLKCFW